MYPYKEYTFRLCIGTGEVEESIHLADFGMDEEDWTSLSDSEREVWLERESQEWAFEYISISFS